MNIRTIERDLDCFSKSKVSEWHFGRRDLSSGRDYTTLNFHPFWLKIWMEHIWKFVNAMIDQAFSFHMISRERPIWRTFYARGVTTVMCTVLWVPLNVWWVAQRNLNIFNLRKRSMERGRYWLTDYVGITWIFNSFQSVAGSVGIQAIFPGTLALWM